MKQYCTVLILQKNRRWNRQDSFYYKIIHKCMNCTPVVLGAVTVLWPMVIIHISVYGATRAFSGAKCGQIIFHLLLLMNDVEADDWSRPQSSFWTSPFARKIRFARAALLRVHTCQHLWSCTDEAVSAGLVWCTCCCFLFVSWPVVSRLQRHTLTDFSNNIRSVCKSHSTEFV